MAKHAAAAEGDRHSPIDITFANAAARTAYTFAADDIWKWYVDDDTGSVWELTSSYLPGFRQKSAEPGGSLLYDYPFKVLTVDASEPSANYSDVASAIAAAVAGDVISIGPGTYVCDNQLLPANVDLVGFGIGITILSTTGVTALTVAASSHISNVTITSTNAAGNSYPLILDDSDIVLDSVSVDAVDDALSNIARAITITANGMTIMLFNCRTTATGAVAYGVHITDGDAELHGGIYNGGDSPIYADGGTVMLIAPQLVAASGGYVVVNAGEVIGTYLDDSGNAVVGRYVTGDLPSAGHGGRLLYEINTGNLLLDVGLSLRIV